MELLIYVSFKLNPIHHYSSRRCMVKKQQATRSRKGDDSVFWKYWQKQEMPFLSRCIRIWQNGMTEMVDNCSPVMLNRRS